MQSVTHSYIRRMASNTHMAALCTQLTGVCTQPQAVPVASRPTVSCAALDDILVRRLNGAHRAMAPAVCRTCMADVLRSLANRGRR